MATAGVTTVAKPSWQARWYLWEGGFMTLGRSNYTVAPHTHHAVQITLGLDGVMRLETLEGVGVTGPAISVSADIEHQLHTMGTMQAILLVDPESTEGRWLTRSMPEGISAIPAERAHDAIARLRRIHDAPGDAESIATDIHAMVRSLCVGPAPTRGIDERVRKALTVIHGMEAARLSLDAVAAEVFLSPSRFAHLFSEQVGLPFRRYVLWRRLTRALVAVGRGRTLTAAAHESGFADSAHLTRTCLQMLGTPPSILMGRSGEFWEIPAPFF